MLPKSITSSGATKASYGLSEPTSRASIQVPPRWKNARSQTCCTPANSTRSLLAFHMLFDTFRHSWAFWNWKFLPWLMAAVPLRTSTARSFRLRLASATMASQLPRSLPSSAKNEVYSESTP